MADIRYVHYDAAGARAQRETIAAVHCDAYAVVVASGDPFESREAFMERFDSHASNTSLGLVIAYVDDEPVGQAWGFPCMPTFADSPGGPINEPGLAGFAYTDGERVFALCEIMVRQEWTGQGIAHGLHDELLASRGERFAELYVRPENTRAYRAYLKWRWRKVGETRPDLPDAPVFDVLVVRLASER